jgi:hypothetical protein
MNVNANFVYVENRRAKLLFLLEYDTHHKIIFTFAGESYSGRTGES